MNDECERIALAVHAFAMLRDDLEDKRKILSARQAACPRDPLAHSEARSDGRRRALVHPLHSRKQFAPLVVDAIRCEGQHARTGRKGQFTEVHLIVRRVQIDPDIVEVFR